MSTSVFFVACLLASAPLTLESVRVDIETRADADGSAASKNIAVVRDVSDRRDGTAAAQNISAPFSQPGASVPGMGTVAAMRLFQNLKPLYQSTPDLNASNDCADYPDLDEWKESTPDWEWCYIRMYRCEAAVERSSVANRDFGDVSWGVTDLGPILNSLYNQGRLPQSMLPQLMVWNCGAFGQYLHVYRLKVKKAILKDPEVYQYAMCNKGKCGYPDPNTGLQIPDSDVHHAGSRRIPTIPGVGVKRQFSFPRRSENKEWKYICHERVVSIENCLAKYTYGRPGHDAILIYKNAVMSSSPWPGCESLSKWTCW